MNPYQRPSPRTASPASNLQTNPSRTNNQRHTPHRHPSFSSTSPYSDRGMEDGEDDMAARANHSPDVESKQMTKVNQVIQNFFTKAALSIVSSRVILPKTYNQDGELKQNKWFNVVIDDSDVLQQQLLEWKRMDATAGEHPPLYIDIYLDTQGLAPNQSLVVHDEHGKRWDVGAALGAAEPASQSSTRTVRPTQIVLERWSIHIGDKTSVRQADLQDPLPNVYKKAVVLFRSLFANLRLTPTFKYYRNLGKQSANNPNLRLNYRISNGDFKSPHVDTLTLPLYPSPEAVTTRQEFNPTFSPIGPLCVSVQYRTNCDFSVDDSESLLSSHFMGMDDNYFDQNRGAGQVPGSLPVNKLHAQDTPDLGQAYGSLSTFHQVGPPAGTSPISALRAARDMPISSPIETPPQKLPPNHRTAQGSKSSLRSADAPPYQRRTSVSFHPFKAGSLSSSPAPGPAVPPSPGSSTGRPGSSLGRTPSAMNQPRNRTSLYTLPQAALRAPSLPNETAITSSASSSPKPAPITRYSSSFGHRRSKFSSGGGSKTEDDNLSSGKGSVASLLQRGSDVMNEVEGASSGEVNQDDDNISDFIKMLESKKDLKSFSRDTAARDATMRKTTAQLNKFQRMRDSHAALSDSVSSSMMLHRSSSSSSRQLHNPPGMVAGTSVSTASSPGKPISPHTPHYPAVPSRLSAHHNVDEPRRSRQSSRNRARSGRSTRDYEPTHADEPDEDDGTTGVDVLNSPHSQQRYTRRSSSAAQQPRNLPDDEPDVFDIRSTSLPTEEGDRARDLQRITSADLTSSGLFTQTQSLARASRPRRTDAEGDADSEALSPFASRTSPPRASSTSNILPKRAGHATSTRGRPSFPTPSTTTLPTHTGRPGSSTECAPPSGAGSTSASATGSSRYNFSPRTANLDDDEPLLFTMSEIGAAGSRRSLEEARGGGNRGDGGKRGSGWG